MEGTTHELRGFVKKLVVTEVVSASAKPSLSYGISEIWRSEQIHPSTPIPTMSRIEELPDDFDESLNLNAPSTSPLPPSTHGAPTPFTPAPGPEIPDTKTADEILDMMRKTPLFMTDLEGAEAGTLSPRSFLPPSMI
jgi:hypothetical protein